MLPQPHAPQSAGCYEQNEAYYKSCWLQLLLLLRVYGELYG